MKIKNNELKIYFHSIARYDSAANLIPLTPSFLVTSTVDTISSKNEHLTLFTQ